MLLPFRRSPTLRATVIRKRPGLAVFAPPQAHAPDGRAGQRARSRTGAIKLPCAPSAHIQRRGCGCGACPTPTSAPLDRPPPPRWSLATRPFLATRWDQYEAAFNADDRAACKSEKPLISLGSIPDTRITERRERSYFLSPPSLGEGDRRTAVEGPTEPAPITVHQPADHRM